MFNVGSVISRKYFLDRKLKIKIPSEYIDYDIANNLDDGLDSNLRY